MRHSQSRMQAASDLCTREIFLATLDVLPRILLCALRRFYISLARRGVFVAATCRRSEEFLTVAILLLASPGVGGYVNKSRRGQRILRFFNK